MSGPTLEQSLAAALNNPEQGLIELDRLDSAESLAAFVKVSWHVLEKKRELKWGWVMDAICDHLEAVTSGQIKRLLINVPPGLSKSLMTGVFWPAWEWTLDPTKRYLGTAHKQDLATRDNLKCRRLIQSDWYQKRWPITLTSDQNAKTKFENDQTGQREAMAFTSLTGSRGDRVILDDPLSVDGAESEAERKAAEFTFLEAVPTRLNDDESAIVVIMQRLHQKDTSGIILSKDLGYEHLMLPMEFEPDRRCSTSIGFTDPRTAEGELLFPERFSRPQVDEVKASLGSFGTAGQLQQRPAPRGGGFLKPHLIEIVSDYPRDVVMCRRWDFAGTEGDGDWTVGLKMAFKEGQAWIVDIWRKQVSPLAVEQALVNTARADGIGTSILVEQEPGSSGKWVAQSMQRLLAGFACYPSRPDQSKELRARPLAAAIEAGNIKMVKADWNDVLIDEFANFPVGAHDDIVDCAADAWLHLSHGLLGRRIHVR